MSIHFNPGRPVAHDRFGVGFVTEVDGSKITVDFSDIGKKKVLGSFLRAPSKGLLPYRDPEQSVQQLFAPYAGSGNVAFLVVAAGIDEFVGATVAEFVIETIGSELIAIPFFLEHIDPTMRWQSLRQFTEFALALGLPSPEDTSDFIGRSGCFRVPAAGDYPAFSRIAS